MHLFKRVCALALAGVLSLSLLAGCKSGGGASSASGSTSAPEIVVDLNAVDDVCVFLSGLEGDEVVATADGMDITAGELMYWIISCYNDRLMNYIYYGSLTYPGEILSADEDITLEQLVMAESMQYVVSQRLVEQKALAGGHKLSQEEKDAIQTSLEALKTDAKSQGATGEMFLYEAGLTEDLFIWNCEVNYLYSELAEALFGDSSPNPPTEAGILEHMEQAGYYAVKHILLATVDLTTGTALDDAAKAQKKSQAEDLLNQLKKSSNPEALFDQLMNEHSEDPGLATSPEGYEFQTNTNVDPAFEEAALALKVGEISELVEGVSGYHIILRLPLEVNLEEDKDSYIGQKMAEQVDEWVAEADIEKTDAFEKLNVEKIYENMIAYSEAVSDLIEKNAGK